MVKILSFDVGIKNLAYCLIEFNEKDNVIDHNIIVWGVINMMDKFTENAIKCSVSKKGCLCGADAINYVEIDSDNTLGFCGKKTCQSVLTSNYNKKQIKKIKKINTKTVTLFDISKEMLAQLSKNENMLKADKVIIENQPVLKNPTMKSIQMILYSFFVITSTLKVKLHF